MDWDKFKVEVPPTVSYLAAALKRHGGDSAPWDCNKHSAAVWSKRAVVAIKALEELGWKPPAP